MNEQVEELAERLRRPFTRPMTPDDVEFLKDAQAMIEFAISNGLTFPMVVSALCSDFNELARDGFDLRRSRSRGFAPKSEGYSKLACEDLADLDEPLE